MDDKQGKNKAVSNLLNKIKAAGKNKFGVDLPRDEEPVISVIHNIPIGVRLTDQLIEKHGYPTVVFAEVTLTVTGTVDWMYNEEDVDLIKVMGSTPYNDNNFGYSITAKITKCSVREVIGDVNKMGVRTILMANMNEEVENIFGKSYDTEGTYITTKETPPAILSKIKSQISKMNDRSSKK